MGKKWSVPIHKLYAMDSFQKVCCTSCWLPCIAMRETATSFQFNNPRDFFIGCIICPCTTAVLFRFQTRHEHNITGNYMQDLGLAICCSPCSVAQCWNQIRDPDGELRRAKLLGTTDTKAETD